MRKFFIPILFLFASTSVIAQDSKTNTEQTFVVGKVSVKYTVENRKATRLPKIDIMTDEHGSVLVDVSVDKYGNVTSAIPNTSMSDTKSTYLITKAKQAAETTHFDTSPTTPLKTKGTMIFTF